jgi:hypothetical protein
MNVRSMTSAELITETTVTTQVMAGGLPLLDNRVVHTRLELLPKAPAS